MSSQRPADVGDSLRLFVFVDALGWNIFQRHQRLFLEGELQTAQPLDTVLGYSCACDPTILTGKMPQEHGHFSFFQYAPERSPFSALRPLGWLPHALTSRGRVRRALSKWVARWHGYDGYFQLYNVPFDRLAMFDYSEKRDLYQPGGILSGHPTVLDHLRDANVPLHVSNWRNSEADNVSDLSAAIDRHEIRWAYLYLAGLDAILHRDGTQATSVADHIRWYDSQLRTLLEQARSGYRDVQMYVFSDHGMTDVAATCDLQSKIVAAERQHDLRFGRDYAAVYDSTMARFWFMSERAEMAIRDTLNDCEDGRSLDDAELHELGCLFPQKQYGELFFLLNPGVLLCPSDMGSAPLRGMHGYSPMHSDSTAFFGATTTCKAPQRLDGLFSLMLSEGLGEMLAAPARSNESVVCQ